MSAALRVRGPGLDWLPAVLRQRATWRTVWRFVWLGPLVGVLPWAWAVVTIPFAYVVGGPAALVAGLLFATWYHGAGRTPTWPWRATLGMLAGLGATAAVAMVQVLMGRLSWDYVAVVAVHGVPAAAVVALMHKPAPPPGNAPVPARTPRADATDCHRDPRGLRRGGQEVPAAELRGAGWRVAEIAPSPVAADDSRFQ